MAKLLEIEALRAGYGSINVLWDLSLAIEEGKLTCILGPNGGGKTTLLRAIMGLVKTEAGRVLYQGADRTNAPTWDMVADGIAMIPEGRMVFRDMSVADNLMMGAFPKKCRANAPKNLQMVYDMFPRLYERRDQLAGALSGGEAQMLAMGRGLMEEPKLILVDEPSLGLAPVVVDEVMGILDRLKQDGRTIVLVEQNTNKALKIADHVYLVRGGKVVLSEAADSVDLSRLHDLYFARDTLHEH
ncbi:High-affinity branched-chain amino acid transport ATP-binding protein LivF,leucine/isoleucine/valine transporter subunit; ATP-binding component of ABC superfamily [Magnetospirillum sp. XM-1]|uniref:ABC transporter ATP-binding protein n=1 Tax=Magnetospirillum sp. XM-1 TaxID=1663591 RepID=UPI00073DD870|nr:ABC transporter ATP-binding protein [Magnetospirillum sp. XM-1]CUW40477.1 High-affinity branched-chain amino acid transport ATP-binding protein LivF,leucine/isoleucine/valine transporter subunit; ATP-binding component of ABC superfamily [Magnetospirillum sp. XM-1]